MMKHKFDFGDRVWHVLDGDDPGIITGILFRPTVAAAYYVTWKDKTETLHYEIELTEDKNFE